MTSRRIEIAIWGALVLTMLGIAARFLTTTGPQKRLPVLGRIGEFQLTNQAGAPVTRDSISGRVGVFDVIFSLCPTQCHKLSQQMRRLQQDAPSGVALWSLTADPIFDTPPVLERYGQRYGADPARWQFLTGPKSVVYRLATADLLFTVVENPDRENAKLEDLFIHATSFAIVDRAGRLRAIVQGEEPDAEAQILRRVRQLLREP